MHCSERVAGTEVTSRAVAVIAVVEDTEGCWEVVGINGKRDGGRLWGSGRVAGSHGSERVDRH